MIPKFGRSRLRRAGEMGLTVLSAEDGAGALKILHENPEIELLLTDIAMPNMTGWELAHAAKQKYPDLEIIYTSGYIKSYPVGQNGMGYGPLLPKPWRRNQLRQHVRAVLGRSPAVIRPFLASRKEEPDEGRG